MKILLSGGGTLGPVVPLLAVYEIYRRHNKKAEFIWVGTRKGPEREIIKEYDIPFFVLVASKWRRYFSLKNLIDLIKLPIAFFQSLILLWQEKPSLLVSFGGFVSVPLHWAAALLGIPTWVHQQDARVGFANRLMSYTATKITTALRDTVNQLPENKTDWIGNPVRDLKVKDKYYARKNLNLPTSGPVILAMGGGTGSNRVNKLVVETLQHLPSNWQIIHLTGKERPGEHAEGATGMFANYHVHKFFTKEMKYAYAVADIVISRGGFASITELASLSKAAILLPMTGTHQEQNVKILIENKAAVALDERATDGIKLFQVIKKLINRPDVREALGARLHKILPPAEGEKVIEVIEELIATA